MAKGDQISSEQGVTQEAARLLRRCDELARISEAPDLLMRRSFTPAQAQAQDLVAGWMREAGMAVRTDAVCNLIGRYDGATPAARTLLLGSHLDTVRDAGNYDGPLGVLAALACVERLHRAGRRLPFAVEVIAFMDEEGLRFHASYLGSSAVAGAFDPQWLALRDVDGISMAEALAAAGGDPDGIPGCAYHAETVLGYCEVHIEQGPLLEARNLPVGVVSAIAGQSRATIGIHGVAGHAGTVPMALRHDALCAAAECILAVEAIGREYEGLVATVGQIAAQPGAGNVIPGQVTLSLDLRHQDDTTRRSAYEAVQSRAGELAQRRGVRLEWEPVQESPATASSPRLAGLLAEAVEAQGLLVLRLPSGAGHDGVALSRLTEIAMLFLRCKDGISHNPAESVTAADVGIAIEVLARFLDLVAATPEPARL